MLHWENNNFLREKLITTDIISVYIYLYFEKHSREKLLFNRICVKKNQNREKLLFNLRIFEYYRDNKYYWEWEFFEKIIFLMRKKIFINILKYYYRGNSQLPK